jgi:hypothetical protein
LSTITVIISMLAGLGLAGYVWITSRDAYRKADKALEIAQHSHKIVKDSNFRKRIKILEMQCEIIRKDFDTLKRLYKSIKLAGDGRISESSLKKMYRKIDQKAEIINKISDYVDHSSDPKDDELILLEEKIVSIEKYAASQRASAGNSLDIVIPKRRKRKLRPIRRR